MTESLFECKNSYIIELFFEIFSVILQCEGYVEMICSWLTGGSLQYSTDTIVKLFQSQLQQSLVFYSFSASESIINLVFIYMLNICRLQRPPIN